MAKPSIARPPAQPKAPRSPVAQKVWKRIYLREWREFRGHSTEKLAELADVSPAIISLIENHRSAGSPDSLEKLAKALNIEVGELLDVKPEKGGSIMRIFVADEDRETALRLMAALRASIKK